MEQDKWITANDLVKIDRSFGQNKTGIPIFFVRPLLTCHNRSHRCVGYDKKDLAIQKWFSPEVYYYVIKNYVIGSNSEMNALREFWRVCSKEEIGILVEIKTLPSPPIKKNNP